MGGGGREREGGGERESHVATCDVTLLATCPLRRRRRRRSRGGGGGGGGGGDFVEVEGDAPSEHRLQRFDFGDESRDSGTQFVTVFRLFRLIQLFTAGIGRLQFLFLFRLFLFRLLLWMDFLLLLLLLLLFLLLFVVAVTHPFSR